MTDYTAWPALARWDADRPASLAIRRGIWGKVHGASSGYRWIARSYGFATDCPDLAGALRIGAEDLAFSAPLWRRLPGRYLALWVYPSRARDSTGRQAILEKQVAEWLPVGGMPSAVAALVLLPALASRTDADWWQDSGDGDWGNPGFAVPLEPALNGPIRIDPDTLSSAIDGALDALARCVDAASLSAFYAALFASRLPARLQLTQPLPPAALAALLLPLPRDWADGLSLAGGLAARALDLHDLVLNWDGIAMSTEGDGGSQRWELADLVAQGVQPDPQQFDLAAAMAEALLTKHPIALPATLAANAGTFVEQPELRTPGASQGTGTPIAATDSTDSGTDPNAEGVTEPALAGLGPKVLHLDGLTRLPSDSVPVLRLLYDFATDVDVDRLDLHAFAKALLATERLDEWPVDQVRVLSLWPDEVAARLPACIDGERCRRKVDQLRAIAALLAAGAE